MIVLEKLILFRSFWLFAILGTFVCPVATAQVDTLLLKGVEISASAPEREMAGVEVQRFDLQEVGIGATGDVGSFLRNHTDLDLRSYGPGGSSLLSIRGSSTSQVQVSINGIPFEMPSLAMTDLSLLPVAGFGQLAVYRGGAAAYLGNAAVGGGIMLDTRRGYAQKGITQSLSLGQFGSRGSVTSFSAGDDKFSTNASLYLQSAENDFFRPHPYRSGEMFRQKNAAIHTRGWLHGTNFTTGKTRISTLFWAGETERQIPAGRSKIDSEAEQEDQNMRAQLTTVTDFGSVVLESAVAYDRGVLNYRDAPAGIDDESTFSTTHARVKAAAALRKVDVYAIFDFRNSTAETATYGFAKNRFTPAITAGVYAPVFGETSRASLVLRQEWKNGGGLPLLPVLGLEADLGRSFRLSGSIGKTFRLPGLNDLYWNPGGNPNLKPESGWFQELSVHAEKEVENLFIHGSIAGFHRLIDNWITWRPGSGYWSPYNILSVRSMGLEGRTKAELKWGKFRITQDLSGSFVISENVETAAVDDESVGKQLIYVPRFSGLSITGVSFDDKWRMTLPLRYVSRRYTTSDHTAYLEPYFLVDIELEYTAELRGGQTRLAVFTAIRNALDREYRMQNSHYMPGRFFETGLRIFFPFSETS